MGNNSKRKKQAVKLFPQNKIVPNEPKCVKTQNIRKQHIRTLVVFIYER